MTSLSYTQVVPGTHHDVHQKWFPEEEDRVEEIHWRSSRNIQGNVIAAEPFKIQVVVRDCQQLQMDLKVTAVMLVRNAENLREDWTTTIGKQHGQQPPHKEAVEYEGTECRAPVARAPYRLAPSEMEEAVLSQLKNVLRSAHLRLRDFERRLDTADGALRVPSDAFGLTYAPTVLFYLGATCQGNVDETEGMQTSLDKFWSDRRRHYVDPAKLSQFKDGNHLKLQIEIRNFLGLARLLQYLLEGFPRLQA
ncbi:hypothetical protein Tco_0554565 [Tanacetum coccineum]